MENDATGQVLPYGLLCLALCLAYGSEVRAAEETMVVRAEGEREKFRRLAPDYSQEKRKLEQIAGGSNLVAIDEENRLATLQDALDYQPGVLIQNFFGGLDQPRLNIRGSGVQSAPLSHGVLLLQDGLPATDADGSFHISTLDMREARLVSVRRGANSIHPQSNSLGGEMDLISYTGRDENGRVRYEYGSFGREGFQGALGGVNEEYGVDGRLAVTLDRFAGYRRHSASQRKTVRSNLGYRVDNFENRTWFGWTDLRFDVAGPVSPAVLKKDPKAVYPLVNLRDPHRSVQQARVANRSSWQDDNQWLDIGLWYIKTHDNFITPANYRLSSSDSEGVQLNYALETGPITWRASTAWDHMNLDRTLLQNRRGTAADKKSIGSYKGRAENVYGTLGAGWQMSSTLLLNLDLKGSHARRDVNAKKAGNSLDQSWTFWTPKAGLIWQAAENQRLFANVSASYEPATFNQIINSGNGELTRLDPQRGLTWEVGGEGQVFTGMNWQLTLYRSMIKDEYITTYDPQGNAVGVFNYAAKTRHQGLEAGLTGLVPAGPGDMEYRLSWTWNDFRFMGGEYNRKYIAGIPRNMVAGEVLYKWGGWSVGPNLHWSPTDAAVDHGNHLNIQRRERYAVLGLKASYKDSGGWSTYLALDNLTNKRYATTSVANRSVSENDSTLFPGMGFSVNGGVTYSF